jgi:hypothetical protein
VFPHPKNVWEQVGTNPRRFLDFVPTQKRCGNSVGTRKALVINVVPTVPCVPTQKQSNRKHMTDLLVRALSYVATLPPAVSGQHGHNAAFRVAATLVHGFALSESDAMPIMEEFNAKCVPPWSRKELEHKLRSAAEWTKYDKPRGHLAGDARQRVEAKPPAPRPKKRITFPWFSSSSASPQVESAAVSVAEAVEDVPLIPQEPVCDAKLELSEAELAHRIDGEQHWGSNDKKEAYIPTPDQLVPPPPRGLSHAECQKYYQEDLELAIGKEFIDYNLECLNELNPKTYKRSSQSK